nr:class II aldolase/adducin family protein [uncultured Halomonas sp.]
MANHGVTVVGDTVSEAFDKLYFLENTCKSQVLVLSANLSLKRIDDASSKRTRNQWKNENNDWLGPVHFTSVIPHTRLMSHKIT